MSAPGPEWVLVQDVGEIEVGMALKHAPCGHCQRWCTGNVVNLTPSPVHHVGLVATVTWRCAPDVHVILTGVATAAGCFLDMGLLYRLRDLSADTGALEDERLAQFRANVRRAAGVTAEAQRVGRPAT